MAWEIYHTGNQALVGLNPLKCKLGFQIIIPFVCVRIINQFGKFIIYLNTSQSGYLVFYETYTK